MEVFSKQLYDKSIFASDKDSLIRGVNGWFQTCLDSGLDSSELQSQGIWSRTEYKSSHPNLKIKTWEIY